MAIHGDLGSTPPSRTYELPLKSGHLAEGLSCPDEVRLVTGMVAAWAAADLGANAQHSSRARYSHPCHWAVEVLARRLCRLEQ